MDDGLLAILWMIILSIGILITIVFMRKYTNIERLGMIEKGLNPGDLSISNKTGQALWPLRFSLLLIGAGLGLFAGYLLDYALDMEEIAYFSMLFIFGGVGLGISYIIEEKRDRDKALPNG